MSHYNLTICMPSNRDLIDSSRDVSPLKRSEDSIEIDSTNLTIDEQIEKIMKIINKNKKGTSKHV